MDIDFYRSMLVTTFDDSMKWYLGHNFDLITALQQTYKDLLKEIIFLESSEKPPNNL